MSFPHLISECLQANTEFLCFSIHKEGTTCTKYLFLCAFPHVDFKSQVRAPPVLDHCSSKPHREHRLLLELHHWKEEWSNKGLRKYSCDYKNAGYTKGNFQMDAQHFSTLSGMAMKAFPLGIFNKWHKQLSGRVMLPWIDLKPSSNHFQSSPFF